LDLANLVWAALLTAGAFKVGCMDHLLDWLSVRTRWLRSRLGEPDGPSVELVAAWERADWIEVSQLCDEWTRQVDAGPLRRVQSDAERDRVLHGLLFPIRGIKTAALMMSGGEEHRRRMQNTKAKFLLNRIDNVVGGMFEFSASGLDSCLASFTEYLAEIFMEAMEYGVDLSSPRADIELDEAGR
jgi:hypothetical protein